MDYTKQFKYISEIRRWQSISTAAEKLHVQQPALSKYLKKVEQELGVELFDRSVSPLMPTKAGKYYLAAAQKVLDADHQLKKQISALQNGNQILMVGISPSRAPYLLPIIFKDYYQAFPEGYVTVVEGTTTELNRDLSHGDLDLIISLDNEETKDFEHIELFDETILLAVPEQYQHLTFEEAFEKLNIISSGKGQQITVFLNTLLEHRSRIECQNVMTALELVRSGLGGTLVPSYMADYGNADGVAFLRLPEYFKTDILRKVCIFYRKEQYLSAAEKHFIDCAVSAVK